MSELSLSRYFFAVLALGLLIWLLVVTLVAGLAAVCGVVFGYCLIYQGWQWWSGERRCGKSVSWSSLACLFLGGLLLASTLLGFGGFALITVFGHPFVLGAAIGFFTTIAVMLLACFLIRSLVGFLFGQVKAGFDGLTGVLAFVFSAFCLTSMIIGLHPIIHFALSAQLWFMIPFILYNAAVAGFCLYVCIRAGMVVAKYFDADFWNYGGGLSTSNFVEQSSRISTFATNPEFVFGRAVEGVVKSRYSTSKNTQGYSTYNSSRTQGGSTYGCGKETQRDLTYDSIYSDFNPN